MLSLSSHVHGLLRVHPHMLPSCPKHPDQMGTVFGLTEESPSLSCARRADRKGIRSAGSLLKIQVKGEHYFNTTKS